MGGPKVDSLCISSSGHSSGLASSTILWPTNQASSCPSDSPAIPKSIFTFSISRIDLPKALLLESIVEDQQLPAQDVPLLSPIITGLTINEKHDLISPSTIMEGLSIDGTAMPDVKRVGLVKYSEPKEITWALVIYPTNDIYQSPNSASQIDHTTSSMICVDDRKPGIPMLLVKHFRSPDLTLSMGFPAEPEWSPDPNYDPSTAGERFDQVLLWSRTNDVASLHQFRSHPDIPQLYWVIHLPYRLPVHILLTLAQAWFSFVVRSHRPCKSALVRRGIIRRIRQELDSDSEDGFTRIPNSSLKLETLSQVSRQYLTSLILFELVLLSLSNVFACSHPDFTDACLSEPPTIDGEDTCAMHRFHGSVRILCASKTLRAVDCGQPGISNDDRSDMMIDLTPVLRSFLPEIINFSSEDAIVVDDDEAEQILDNKSPNFKRSCSIISLRIV
ncbi:hypothetical protein H4Q26_005344 [Puccinia striiformis f. sp. tritici PST-130]|nr:hypothetical protein H4Q26_005344 [Puccinia striiformis f. sp. tritici PST-130]